MIKVIGLSGKAGVGKDYIAKTFLAKLGYLPIALADSVKELAVTQGRCTYEEAFITKPPHARTALQKVGTEEGRNIWGEDCWCRTLDARIRWIAQRWGHNKFVVTDVRFPNEVHFIQDLGGEVYRIYAPDRHALIPLTDEQRQHPSETALDQFDIIEGTKQKFGTMVAKLVDGKLIETPLWDAVIDNRISPELPLFEQMTAILRVHDHIRPDQVLIPV